MREATPLLADLHLSAAKQSVLRDIFADNGFSE